MNILVLNYEFPPIGGGASPVSKDIAIEMVKMGHKVKVVTMGYAKLPKDENVQGIDVHRVKCLRTKPFVCYPWEQLTYLISGYFYIKKMMKKGNAFDAVHVHFIIPTGVLAWWMKKKYGLNYIVTAHGSDVPGHNKKRFVLLHKLLIKPWKVIVKQAYAVVSPSVYLADMIKHKVPELNCTLISNGVNTNLFGELPKEKIILVMSRLQETKGIQIIIEALSKMERMGNWKLYIAGDGPYADTLKKMVEEYSLQNCVRFCGWVENKSEKHVELVGKSAIYISASTFENSPISVLEAMSAKCNVLLSDISAHQQIKDHVDSVELFSVNNAEDLAQKLQFMMDAIDKNGGYSHEHEMSRFDLKDCAKKYLEVLEGCKSC